MVLVHVGSGGGVCCALCLCWNFFSVWFGISCWLRLICVQFGLGCFLLRPSDLVLVWFLFVAALF